jgi:hypothetical protein
MRMSVVLPHPDGPRMVTYSPSSIRRSISDDATIHGDRTIEAFTGAPSPSSWGGPSPLIANALGIPFFVCAPLSTFDFSLSSGDQIVIEERAEEEVTMVGRTRLAPKGSVALNPSFDMTPAKYVTGFITEAGVLLPSEIDKVRKVRFEEAGQL